MSKTSLIRSKLAEGYTQTQVAEMLSISQSSVSYHGSKATAKAAQNRNYCRYRIQRCSMNKERFVVYKRLDTLYMTNEQNYNSPIQNASQITTLSDFNTFDEVVAFFEKYGNTKGIEFVDRTGGEKV